MKVLYIINSLKRGGAEVLVSQIVPAMKKKNIEVDLLLLDNTNTSIIDNLRDQNVNILSSQVNIGSHNPLWIYYLKDFIPNYDIIHVHLFPANYWSILFKILFRSKMKYVLTIHSTMTRRWKNPLFRFLEKHILQKYDKLVVVSDQAKYNLDKFITKFDTVEVILNGIDLLKIKNAKPISLGYLCKGEENIYIAMVARFDYPKDQPTLIKSLLHLPDKYKLILIGEGENIEKCRKMVFDLTLDNRVYFLGV